MHRPGRENLLKGAEAGVGQTGSPLDECVHGIAVHICQRNLCDKENGCIQQAMLLKEPLESIEITQIASECQVLIAPEVHVVHGSLVIFCGRQVPVELGGLCNHTSFDKNEVWVINIDINDVFCGGEAL